ncbi:MAG: fatty acid desaturase [Pseudomonadota bacterium]
MTDALDHTTVLAALPAEAKAALTARSDRAGLLHLAGHVGAIAATGTGIALGMPYWPLLLLPHGILLTFLFTLEHEATHQTPFATPRLNESVGHACGAILFLPFTWFRYFHLAHHRFTGDPDRDPELQSGGRPDTWRTYLFYLSGWGYFSGLARVIWSNARGALDASYIPARAKPRIQREARLLLTLYALAAISLLFTPILFWIWLLPMVIGQPFLRLYLLAEHGRCPPVANMFENTRTTFTNRLVRFIAWNMPYHAEHHAWPQVPFHHLPALHDAVAQHLQSTAPSYRAFTRDYARSLTDTG